MHTYIHTKHVSHEMCQLIWHSRHTFQFYALHILCLHQTCHVRQTSYAWPKDLMCSLLAPLSLPPLLYVPQICSHLLLHPHKMYAHILSHTHTLTRTHLHSQSHFNTPTLSQSHALSLSPTLTLVITLTLTLKLMLTLTLKSHARSHVHS